MSGESPPAESAIDDNIHQSANVLLANNEIRQDAVDEGDLTILEAKDQLHRGEVLRLEER